VCFYTTFKQCFPACIWEGSVEADTDQGGSAILTPFFPKQITSFLLYIFAIFLFVVLIIFLVGILLESFATTVILIIVKFIEGYRVVVDSLGSADSDKVWVYNIWVGLVASVAAFYLKDLLKIRENMKVKRNIDRMIEEVN